MARVWSGPTTRIGSDVKLTVATPTVGERVTWTPVRFRNDWMPSAASVAVGPARSAPTTWVSEAGTATSRVAATRCPVGATRKISSGTPTAGGAPGTVVVVVAGSSRW